MADVAVLTVSILGSQTVTPAANAAVSALSSVESAAGRTVGAFTSMAAAAAKASAAMIAVGAAGAVALGGNAIKVAADFEQQISAISAVSNKAEVEVVGGLKAIGDAALQLGKDTSFSATEAAAGMEEMVKAGVSLTDVMGGGAKAALDLAAAGALSVSEAATVASNAMNAFALSGKDLPHIADTLANAANASATDVHQLGLGLASVGAVAHTVGLSFEDTTTAIAEFAQAGLKGSDAGTSFKTFLLSLTPSTKPATKAMRELGIITADGANQFFDAQGKVKSFADISGVLQTAMKGLTKEQQINALQTMFGTDAIRAAAIMAEKGAEGADKLTQAQKEVGGASAVAKERLNNLKGAMEALGGSWEVIRIKIGTPFLPILTKAAQALTKALNEAEPAISAFAEKAAAGLDRMIQRATAAAPRFLALGKSIVAGFQNDGVIGALSNLLPVGLAIKFNVAVTQIERGMGRLAASAKEFVSGFNAGELIKAFLQIQPVVMTVGRAIVTNITETFNFLVNRVLPPVVSIIQQIGTVLERTLLPAAAATGATMRGIFGDTLDWLAKTVMPPFLSIVEQTSDFLTQTVLPTLPAVATALRATLGETVQWLADTVWPRLRVAADAVWTFISGTIVPGLPVVARLLRDLLGGAIQWLADTGWPALVKGATAAWKFLQDNVIPVVKDTYDWLKVKLPEAINTVVSTFETIKGKVGPIVEAALNGDIIGAIRNLGSAFGEFATLAAGWLGEQAAKIDWAAVWSQTRDAAVALGTYLLGLTVDFATWLGDQVSKISWASVWQRVVDAAPALLTYLMAQAVDFATWLGQEVAKIPWGLVWSSIVDVATALATYLKTQVVDYATWLGEQVALIPWATVWGQIKDAATSLATYLQTLTVDFATWLGQQVALIPWTAVWDETKLTAQQVVDGIGKAATGLDVALSTWLQQQITAIKWDQVGQVIGKFLGDTIVGTISSGDGGGLKPETVRKAFYDFFVGVFTGLWTSLKTPLQQGFNDLLNSLMPTRPNWWPTQVPWPFGPQPGSGQQFPYTPPGQSPGGGGTGQGAVQQTMSSQESMIARSKQIAIERGLKDPDLFAAQLMQESSFDPHAFAPNSAGGARGIGQFIPSTGTTYATKLGVTYEQMVNDAELSMQAAAMHMRDLQDQYGGSQERAMSAYFAGPGGGVQPGYVSAVRGRLPQVQGIPAASGATTQMAQPVGSGGGEGMVTYQDEWGNQYTVTESQFATRQQVARGTNPVTVIGRQAAQQAGAATKPPATASVNMANFAIGNQFEMGLPMADAMAACGPAAVALFMEATGRTPNAQEVLQISAKNGWTRGAGMGGVEAFKRTLSDEGINYATLPANATAAAQSAATGNLTAISTGGGNVPVSAGHYFVAQGFNPETGEFDLGETGGGPGGALKDGSRFMTAAQIEALAGPINGVIQLAGQVPPAMEAAATATDTLVESTAAIPAPMAEAGAAIATTGEVAATLPEQVQAAADGTTAATEMVTASFDLMRAGVQTSVTDLGTGVLTTTQDMSGNTVATVTDMSGQVTAQSATLANGVSLNMADMNTQTTTSVDEMAGTITTTMTGVNGDSVSTVTDMKGKVVGQFTTMKTDAGSAVAEMAAKSKEQFNATGKSATDMGETVVDAGQSLKQIPQANMQDTVKQFGAVAEAAKKAQKAIKDLADATEDLPGDFGGSKSGSGKSSGLGKKAAGGWTVPGQQTLVGELGPELISTDRPMYVNTAGETRQMMGGSTRTTVNNFYGVVPETVLERIERENRKDELMYLIGG